MDLVVKKFGGTSVGDISKIQGVADLIVRYISQKNRRVVAVVSAMAGETNRLLHLGRSCVASPVPRELDVLLSTGEQVTTALLAMALCERGVKAKSFSGWQANISTDRNFSRAHIKAIDTKALNQALEGGFVPVVAGFQGIDDEGDITTLGRGGSDITAVALAAALKADRCYIYTDVPGVFTADPSVCSSAKLLRQISHEEMLEFSSLGAKVLHPRSVYFAMAYNIPLVVKSTFQEGSGTWIVKEGKLMEKPIVTGITYRTDEAKITVSKLPAASSAFGALFKRLANEGIFIDMITQTGFDGKLTDISFTVLDEQSSLALEITQNLVPELRAQGAFCDRNIAKISVIGIGMRYHTGVAARIFEALAKEDIAVEMISTSEIKVSVVVPRKYWEVAVHTLHSAFVGEDLTIEKESQDEIRSAV
ncbi:MAG: aspartate kinase [Candidatus Dadabacteria bacterium]|nr:MAG: aspartate kinase [Candidatus Dadabacteria bacterium]